MNVNGYCYHSVEVTIFSLTPFDHIKRLLLNKNSIYDSFNKEKCLTTHLMAF